MRNDVYSVSAHKESSILHTSGIFSVGLLVFFLTSIIIFCGVWLGQHSSFFYDDNIRENEQFVVAFARWDGQAYLKILKNGYSYNPYEPSIITLFPLYPLVSRLVHHTTGASPEWSLFIVANIFCYLSFVIFALYVRDRYPQMSSKFPVFVLITFGVFPPVFFHRMCYSESSFLFLALLAMFGIQKRWPLSLLGCVVGLATAARPVGVSLVLPFMIHVWMTSSSYRQAALRVFALLPLALSGLLLFMLYQWSQFGNPIAFAENQQLYRYQPSVTISDKVIILLSLEPIWSVFDSTHPAYWKNHEPGALPVFSLWFANPIYFLLMLGLGFYGAWKFWLNEVELVFCASLFMIPYVTRSYEYCFGSQARFVSVVFPAYVVLSMLLWKCHWVILGIIFLAALFFAFVYSALFASWHQFI